MNNEKESFRHESRHYDIIDFHVHPFTDIKYNICSYTESVEMTEADTASVPMELGISKICGSVIRQTVPGENLWGKIRELNDRALELRDKFNGYYIPGFHVHPSYVEESIAEIRRMHSEGVSLVGELVPYNDGWETPGYGSEEFSVIVDEIAKHNMVVSLHTMEEDGIAKLVKEHKDVVFVAAHIGDCEDLMRHVETMKLSENYYVDLSGSAFRYGMLRHAINHMGADRILFGTDYPVSHPAMYIGGVVLDNLVSDSEKEKILYKNAARLLKL